MEYKNHPSLKRRRKAERYDAAVRQLAAFSRIDEQRQSWALELQMSNVRAFAAL